ncbi:MAG: DUF2723 domain-containing protein [Elusimicrobia bacterium]|nr:DUF2723 domain-containing protein [Elusimicrobiota bacterium]
MREALLLGAGAFCLYLYTMPASLAAYRDAGEFAASAYTLGVSHPPGYPLYLLLARASLTLGLGDPAYRLGLLSALCAAAASAALFLFARARWGLWAAIGAAALLALNPVLWSVAQVQEMYSLSVLGAVALMAWSLRLKENYRFHEWLAFALFYGLMLSNRLDILLWAPGLLFLALAVRPTPGGAWWALAAFGLTPFLIAAFDANSLIVPLILGTVLWRYRGANRAAWLWRTAAFAALGLALYLYLPLRSAREPWLDWSHPADLSNFMGSVLRSKYGGTLDLLSKSYAKGELFGENAALYARHLWDWLGPLGLVVVFAGAGSAFKRDKDRFLGQACAYWWSGPVFLFLANMPPNPHAAAIVEPHYLLSDVVLAFWAAEGLGLLSGIGSAPATVLAGFFIGFPFARGLWSRMDRRDHLFAYDFARNALLSAPRDSVLVARKDVQLYNLWYYQTAHGWRPDVKVVAQGLAGSPWYQSGWRKRSPELRLMPLRDAQTWERFLAANPAVSATFDAELPLEISSRSRSRGLLMSWAPTAPADSEALWELMVRRGRYEYEGQPDFFTSDLVESYAQARLRQGSEAVAAGLKDTAATALRSAWAMHWLFPEPPLFLGFQAYQLKDYPSARLYYGMASRFYEELLELARRYRALPGVSEQIARSNAETITHQGVICEKMGELEAARSHYEKALSRFPLAQTHYNLAVLFWKKDIGAAERHLREALRLDPHHAEARRYLALIQNRK